MEALFQIGKELSELRSRVEALEQSARAHSDALSSSELLSEYPSGTIKSEPAPSKRIFTPAAITHRVPNIPLFLDGEFLEDPQEITQRNGQPLHYTLLRIRGGIALAAFTDRQAMISESSRLASTMTIESNTADTSEHICTSNPDSLGERVQFFEDINESGDTIGLNAGRAYSDLTRVSHGLFGDWNDEISSVSWCRWDVSLFEHINYGGSELFLPRGCNSPVIGVWSDHASSVVNWGPP